MKKIEEKLEKNNIRPTQISLDFHTFFWYGNFKEGEPVDTVVDILLSDENDEKKKIGEFIFTVIRGYTFEQKENNILWSADEISQELYEVVQDFIDENGRVPDEFMNSNLAYIYKMYINKEYRNKGIGTYSFAMLYDMLQERTSLITVIPEPYDYEEDKEIEDDKEYNSEKNKIINLLEKFDFKKNLMNFTVYYKNTDYKLSLLND
ncbi:MAG: hypothetical protein ACOCV1_08395, partial [Bacillota bacterium]